MKDAARLLAYFAFTLLIGAVLAPILYWSAQWLVAHHVAAFLAHYDFEKYFHRALLVAAILLLWPLLRWLRIRRWSELGLNPNQRPARDLVAGFLFATVPLLCGAIVLLLLHRYALRNSVSPRAFLGIVGATIAVPLLEELLFRGLILGILLRAVSRWFAVFLTSALFSILHFLKTPEHHQVIITWTSGFVSLADSFAQFRQPLLVLAGFVTLFLLGWILADARLRTCSLWLPIGLHAGWIFASGVFGKTLRRQAIDLPWLGNSLLVGLVPLTLALLTWLLLHLWWKHESARAT